MSGMDAIIGLSLPRIQGGMPIGIPTPSFGLTETAPAVPSPWSADTTGFFYVEPDHAQSTDTPSGGEPTPRHGYPAKPRKTIPVSIPAGSVVEIHGTYSTAHISHPGTALAISGTVNSPVFIRGVSVAAAPTLTRGIFCSGSYFIFENLNWVMDPAANEQVLKISTYSGGTDHACVRHCDLTGNTLATAVNVSRYSTVGDISNLVFLDLDIHDTGNVDPASDEDKGGMTILSYVSNAWVLDCTIHRTGGTGLQINAGSQAAEGTLHHIYVGRCEFYDNWQAGTGVKQCSDVIFSQNYSHDIVETYWSPAKCYGYQYGPERLWFLFNRGCNACFGFAGGSDSGGTGVNVYLIGNVIWHIGDTDWRHYTDYAKTTPAYSTPSSTSEAGHRSMHAQDVWMIGNTFHDCRSGVTKSGGTAAHWYVKNNIFSDLNDTGGHHIAFDSTGAMIEMDYNAFYDATQGPIFLWGGVEHDLAWLVANTTFGDNCISTDPSYVSAPTNLRLATGSPAIDAGTPSEPDVFATFQSLYGIDIRKDLTGASRPTGDWDMGAYGYVS